MALGAGLEPWEGRENALVPETCWKLLRLGGNESAQPAEAGAGGRKSMEWQDWMCGLREPWSTHALSVVTGF